MKKSISIIILIIVFISGVVSETAGFRVISETAHELYQKGYEAYEAENYEEAIKYYKQVLNIDPNYAMAHQVLGFAYEGKGMIEEAISEYKQAIAINPKSYAHYYLSKVYYGKGMFDEAISEYKQIITINPNFAEAHLRLGAAYYEKGSLDEAIPVYKKALTILYIEKERYEEVSPGFKAGYTRSNLAVTHHALGLAYYIKGRLDEAITEYIRGGRWFREQLNNNKIQDLYIADCKWGQAMVIKYLQEHRAKRFWPW